MLSTSNTKIIEFYDTHKHINFEKANLLLIQLLDYSLHSHSSTDENILMKVLSTIDNKVSTLQSSVSDVSTHLQQSFSTQLSSIKDSYLHDIDKSFKSFSHDQQSQLDKLLCNNLIDKITILLDTNVHQKLLPQLSSFDTSIKKDIQHAIQSQQQGQSSKIIIDSLHQTIHSKFESIHQYILDSHSQLIEHDSSYRSTLDNIQQFFERQKNSSNKGSDSEHKVEQLLNQFFPDASIENTTGKPKSCDFMIQRVDKPTIMIENKDYSNNVPICEVEKFIRDIDHNSLHGIFISQNSGIARKQHFQIDIHNQSVLIYIHHLQYDFDKVKLAVHTIDYISSLLSSHENSHENIHLSLHTLQEINKEYQHFLYQRTSLLDTLKTFNKDMNKQISSLELNSLSSILSKHFASTEAIVYKCSICKTKQFKNAKALAAHTSKCKKNISPTPNKDITIN